MLRDEREQKIFTNNLGFYLKICGMQQLELAKAINVSPSAITDWMKGRTMPRVAVVQRIAKVFGCELSDLLTDKRNAPEDDDISEDALDKSLVKLLVKLPDSDISKVRSYVQFLLASAKREEA